MPEKFNPALVDSTKHTHGLTAILRAKWGTRLTHPCSFLAVDLIHTFPIICSKYFRNALSPALSLSGCQTGWSLRLQIFLANVNGIWSWPAWNLLSDYITVGRWIPLPCRNRPSCKQANKQTIHPKRKPPLRSSTSSIAVVCILTHGVSLLIRRRIPCWCGCLVDSGWCTDECGQYLPTVAIDSELKRTIEIHSPLKRDKAELHI